MYVRYTMMVVVVDLTTKESGSSKRIGVSVTELLRSFALCFVLKIVYTAKDTNTQDSS